MKYLCLSFTILLVSLYSCENNPVGSDRSRNFYKIEVSKATDSTLTVTLNIVSVSKPSNLTFSINGLVPDSIVYDINPAFDGFNSYYLYRNAFLNQELHVIVNSSLGTISGSVSIPSPTTIILPDSNSIADTTQDLYVRWTGKSSMYRFSAYSNYVMDFGIDTFIVDTSFVLNKSYLKKWHLFQINILGFNGNVPGAGLPANLNGDGFGYLYVFNHIGTHYTSYGNLYGTTPVLY